MRRILTALGVLLVAATASARTIMLSGTTCPGSGCTTVVASGAGTVGLQITGTFSGTLVFEQSNNDSTWVALTLYDTSAPTTEVTSTTTTGLFSGPVAGIKTIRVRFSSYSSGTAIVDPIRAQAQRRTPAASAAGGAPTNATYLTKTANSTLSAEQALASLSTGLMNVTTTTGAVTSIVPTDDSVVVGNGTAWQLKALASCSASDSAVTYNTSTNAFGCHSISASGTPGGASGTLQYNNSNALGGIAGSSWDGTTLGLPNVAVAGSGAGVLDLAQGAAPGSFPANTISLYAPATVSSSYQWKLPAADAAGPIVSSGAGTPGVLSIVTGGVTASGSSCTITAITKGIITGATCAP